MYKGIILDFDGTLTKLDVLDFLANAVGKGKESKQLREDFQSGRSKGIGGLIQRIELLRGTKISFIKEQLTNSLLLPGHESIHNLLLEKQLHIVMVSGNICPVIRHYQSYFNTREVFCTELMVEDGVICGVNSEKIGKRHDNVWRYFREHNIHPPDVVTIGDDLSDSPFFNRAGWSIGFNAKGTLAEQARQNVGGDLHDLTAVLKALL